MENNIEGNEYGQNYYDQLSQIQEEVVKDTNIKKSKEIKEKKSNCGFVGYMGCWRGFLN